MEQSGTHLLPFPPERVRAILRDPGTLARLLARQGVFRPVAPGLYEGVVVVGVPPLAQRYPARLRTTFDNDVVVAEVLGEGRAAGSYLQAECRLCPGPGAGTTLHYRVRAELGGSARLFGTTAAARLTADFLRGLEELASCPDGPGV